LQKRDDRDTSENKKSGAVNLCFSEQDSVESVLNDRIQEYASGGFVKLPGVSHGDQEEFDTHSVPGLDISKGIIEGKNATVLRDIRCLTVFVQSRVFYYKKIKGIYSNIKISDGTERKCPEV
jgi:hypothetical protein